MEPGFKPLNEKRLSWPSTLLIGGICLIALVGIVIAIRGGVVEYPSSVVRLLLACTSIVFVHQLFRPHAIHFDRRVAFVMVFSAVAFLSTLASPGFFASLARLELYYSVVVFGLAIGLALRHCSPGIGTTILFSISVVHAGFLFIALQFAAAAVGNPDPVAAPPFFVNARHFAHQGFFAASAAVAVALADKRFRTAGVLLTMAALFGIIMFGSRGALLAWILFVAAAAGLVPNRRTLVMVGLPSIVGALLLALVAEQQNWLNTFSLLDRAISRAGNTLSALYVQDRIEIWRDSLTAIAQRPILGFGAEGYQTSRCCNPNLVDPHNSILQILLEFGTLGLVSLVTASIAVFWPRVREIVFRTPRLERDPIEATTLAILAGFAGFSLIDGLFYYPIPLVHLALVCAVLLATPAVAVANPVFGHDRVPIQSPTSSPDT
jgi:O-antigen ligase